MPYKDPLKRRKASKDSMRRKRAREGPELHVRLVPFDSFVVQAHFDREVHRAWLNAQAGAA